VPVEISAALKATDRDQVLMQASQLDARPQPEAQPKPRSLVALQEERRRHKRIAIALHGRFMRETKQEFICRVLNICIGDADISTDEVVEEGERIVIYLETLGGLEGTVTRVFAGGFSLQLRATVRKQQKLAAQLTWLINQHELGATAQRRIGHERYRLDNTPITVTFADGSTTQCSAIDVSISGAKLSSTVTPPVGAQIQVSKLAATVVRHHEGGFSVQFEGIQHVEAIRRYFG